MSTFVLSNAPYLRSVAVSSQYKWNIGKMEHYLHALQCDDCIVYRQRCNRSPKCSPEYIFYGFKYGQEFRKRDFNLRVFISFRLLYFWFYKCVFLCFQIHKHFFRVAQKNRSGYGELATIELHILRSLRLQVIPVCENVRWPIIYSTFSIHEITYNIMEPCERWMRVSIPFGIKIVENRSDAITRRLTNAMISSF